MIPHTPVSKDGRRLTQDPYCMLSASAWSSTADWSKPRDLDHLPDFLEHHSASGKKLSGLAWAPESNGAPHTILVTGAALRAADISRCAQPTTAMGGISMLMDDQGRSQIPVQRCCSSKALCQAHQAQGRRTVCEELEVRYTMCVSLWDRSITYRKSLQNRHCGRHSGKVD